MMFFYLYKTTNLINEKIYIGVHRASRLNDGYLGSGKILKAAIKKYGRQNFTKEILETFQSETEMFSREREIVNNTFILQENTYNLRKGGDGFNWVNKNDLHWVAQKDAHRQTSRLNGRYTFENNKGIFSLSPEQVLANRNLAKLKAQESCLKKYGARSAFAHLNKNPEFILKRIQRCREVGHQIGSKNSNYGNCWIYNENSKENKTVKKENVQLWLTNGWQLGRKMKYNNKI